jgi:soluble lytic murein transglycosylase-like protein
MQEWYAYVKVTAEEFKLDPNLCAALAAGESGKGKEEVRFCWVGGGKYHGPYNLARCFLKYGNITDWKVNTRLGIATLAHKLKKYGSLWNALRHYNTGDGPAQFERYYRNIERLRQRYKERKVFEEPRNFALRMTK